jgi:hypothetical protein
LSSGGHAGDERGVVGEPAVHVGDALDAESPLAERLPELVHARAGARLQGGWLLPDTHVLRDPVAHDTAHAREAEPHVTGRLARYCGPAAWVVTEEQQGRRAAEPGELIARPGYLVVADGEENEVIPVRSRGAHDLGCGLGPVSAQNVAGG